MCSEVDARGGRRTSRSRDHFGCAAVTRDFDHLVDHREISDKVQPTIGRVAGLQLLSLHEVLRSDPLDGPAAADGAAIQITSL